MPAVGGQSRGRSRARRDPTVELQEPAVFFARGIECVETFCAAGTGTSVARKMDELILAFNAAGIRYLLVGGQAMRLTGMPRFSMDWDFFIPPHDENNFDDHNVYRIQIGDVVARYVEDSHSIVLTVEGNLPPSTLDQLVADLQGKLTRLENTEFIVRRW